MIVREQRWCIEHRLALACGEQLFVTSRSRTTSMLSISRRLASPSSPGIEARERTAGPTAEVASWDVRSSFVRQLLVGIICRNDDLLLDQRGTLMLASWMNIFDRAAQRPLARLSRARARPPAGSRLSS